MLAVLCARGRAGEVHREEQGLGDSGSGGGSARAYLPRLGPQWSGRIEVAPTKPSVEHDEKDLAAAAHRGAPRCRRSG